MSSKNNGPTGTFFVGAALLGLVSFCAGIFAVRAKTEESNNVLTTPNTKRRRAAVGSRDPAIHTFADYPGTGFFDKLTARAEAIDSLLCVGLDPHSAQLEEQSAAGAFEFCRRLVDATTEVALAYKPNAAFFEAFGSEGIAALKAIIKYIPADIPVLLDAKRGDIGTTAEAYASAAYSELGVESVTVNAYMGTDTVAPFIMDPARGVFVLCKTSNPSSSEIQGLKIEGGGGEAVFERVATLAQGWGAAHNNVGLVVGATDTDALKRARRAAPHLWILAPGIGAQGGDLSTACAAGLDSTGMGLLLPISRGISAAKAGPATAAAAFRDAINVARRNVKNMTCEDSTVPEGELQPYQREFIKFAMDEGVLKFGSFTLKSGRISPYFFNAGLFSSGEALAKLGGYYAQAIVDSKIKFDVLFGPAYKGIPLGGAVAHTLYDKHNINIGFAYNRKEAKDHGEGGTLVGAEMRGKRVLIVDDVITAGTAIRESMDILNAAGATAVGVVLALDRQEKGKDSEMSAVQQVVEEFGIPVISVVGLRHVAAFFGAGGDPKVQHDIAEYRALYGVA